MSKLPQKPRIRNPEKTREKLLQATIQLVAEKGVDALSLKEAAKLADVSRAAAYLHFESRDHLLKAAKEWISDQLSESISEVNQTSIDETIYNVAKLILENGEACKLFALDLLSAKDFDLEHPLHKILLDTLAGFKASGNAREDIDDVYLSFIMLGVVFSVLMTGRLRETSNTDEIARRFTIEWTKILRHGLFKEGYCPE